MDSHVESTYNYLKDKYGRLIIGKKEVAYELNIGMSTLDLYIANGIGVPPYKRATQAKNARLLFNILDLAIYINDGKIETM